MARTWILPLALLACQAAHERPQPESDAAPPELVVDTRDQYALLADIEAALGDALRRDPAALAAVRQRWQGQRFRWELAYVPMLCSRASACHLAPFDHGRLGDRRIQQGWMPKLELDDAGFAELGRMCAGHGRCVVQIEATLRDFVFDAELPTSLGFADVRWLGARDAGPDESWIASRAPLRPRT